VQQAKGLLHRLRHAPIADSMLGVMYAPLFPFVDKVHLNRHKRRTHNPSNVLVPDGYTVEVVASGFNEPVHCCFGDDAFACVTECGYKIDSKPRIVKVDTTTGASETFFELPFDRWRKTRTLTAACWHDGSLYRMNTDTLSRLTPRGKARGQGPASKLPHRLERPSHRQFGPTVPSTWSTSARSRSLPKREAFASSRGREDCGGYATPLRRSKLVPLNRWSSDPTPPRPSPGW
jgi:hypothetical protein